MATTSNKQLRMATLRERAEAAISELTLDLPHPQIKNYRHLLHELEVYQAEIEIQNEELRATQLALTESRDAYESLYNSVPVGHFTLTPTGIVQEANTTGMALLASSRQIIIGKPFTQWIDRESQDDFYHHNRNVHDAGAASCELKMVKSDGTQFDAQLESVTKDTNGNISSGVDIAILDVTSRRQAERQAKEYEELLRGSIANLPHGIILIDQEHRVCLANSVGQRHLAEMVTFKDGDRLLSLGNINLDDIFAYYAVPARLEQPPLEILLESSSPRSFALTAQSIDGPDNYWVLIVCETTKMRQAEQHAKKQELLAIVGQLATGVAHEFNNVLQIMISYAQIVQNTQGDLLPANQEHLHTIVEQGFQAAGMVRQVLDFSRQSSTEKRPVDLVALLQETTQMLAKVLPDTITVNLSTHPNENSYLISADAAQLQRAFVNLAFNARDAMPGGGAVDFHLSKLQLQPDEYLPVPELTPGSWIVLTISDSGMGISTEHMDKIFDPFFTTKEVGQGTGLGLAQVHGIIGQHGGVILADSPTAGGANFTIYLQEIVAIPSALLPSPDIKIFDSQGKAILLVEDEPIVANALKSAIEGLGFAVFAAANGNEAMHLLAQHKSKICLVITDIAMPVMDGLTLAKAIEAEAPTLRVIALSGYPVQKDNLDAVSSAIVEWLPKPIRLESLIQIIKQHSKPIDYI